MVAIGDIDKVEILFLLILCPICLIFLLLSPQYQIISFMVSLPALMLVFHFLKHNTVKLSINSKEKEKKNILSTSTSIRHFTSVMKKPHS